jgi:hypothetical protein
MRFRSVLVTGLLLTITVLARSQDADQQKLIQIEKELADEPINGPKTVELTKKYFYDATVTQLTGTGVIAAAPKAKILEIVAKPDPSDPNAAIKASVSDFRVQIYGDAATVAYRMTETDTGNKEAGLNATNHYGCLDTFLKRDERWLLVANACAPRAPLSAAQWAATKKAMANEPKDVQELFH